MAPGASGEIALAEQLRFLIVRAKRIVQGALADLATNLVLAGITGRESGNPSSEDAGLRICGFGNRILRASTDEKLPRSCQKPNCSQARSACGKSAALRRLKLRGLSGTFSILDVFAQRDLAGFCKSTIRLLGTQRSRPAGFLNYPAPLISAGRLEFCQNFG